MSQTLITFVVYIACMLLLGCLGFRATRNLSDYILGGRRIGSLVTALSTGASDMGGWLLMGLPGAVYLYGISKIWIAVGLVGGAWLNWRFVAARLRIYTEKTGALTLPDYFTARFAGQGQALRIIATLIILIFFTLYCAGGVVAGARLFENIFGLSYETALLTGAATTIIYVFLGGFFAISWTDSIQAILVISAMVMAPLMLIHASGGLTNNLHVLATLGPNQLSWLHHLTGFEIISLLAWGLGYFGQPHILVRFMATESAQTIPKARRINITWMSLCLLGAICIGLFGSAYFALNPGGSSIIHQNPELVFIEVAKLLFNPWFTGLFLAAVLAAIMSNLSCQLLVCSSALTGDLYKTFLRPKASDRELLYIGRLMVLTVAALAIWIASDPNSRVLKMVSYAWAGFGASFGPVVLISLLWTRMTRNGAIAGMLVGALTVLVWKHFAWFGLYEIVPGFLLSSVAIITVSLLEQMPALSTTSEFGAIQKEG